MDSPTEVVDTRYGPMRIFIDDPGCSKIIKEYGEYSPAEVVLMGLYLEPSSVVVDVGANIGGLTMPLATMAGQVYAFEPQAEVAEVLRENVRPFPNVEVIQCGLGEKPKTLRCGPETSNWEKGSRGSYQLSETRGSETVEVKTLDSFGLAPTLLKIDVEGMEIAVLAGALETIRKHRPYIWMERNFSEKILVDVFKALGYIYSSIDLPTCYPNTWNGHKPSIYPSIAHMSLLAVPYAKVAA